MDSLDQFQHDLGKLKGTLIDVSSKHGKSMNIIDCELRFCSYDDFMLFTNALHYALTKIENDKNEQTVREQNPPLQEAYNIYRALLLLYGWKINV